jgi:hypothetical protein
MYGFRQTAAIHGNKIQTFWRHFVVRSRFKTDSLDRRVQTLTDVSSAAYAELQIIKVLGNLKKFSSEDEIAVEAHLPEARVHAAIGWLLSSGMLESSAPGAVRLWRLSAEGLDFLKRKSSLGESIHGR